MIQPVLDTYDGRMTGVNNFIFTCMYVNAANTARLGVGTYDMHSYQSSSKRRIPCSHKLWRPAENNEGPQHRNASGTCIFSHCCSIAIVYKTDNVARFFCTCQGRTYLVSTLNERRGERKEEGWYMFLWCVYMTSFCSVGVQLRSTALCVVRGWRNVFWVPSLKCWQSARVCMLPRLLGQCRQRTGRGVGSLPEPTLTCQFNM